MLFVLGIEVPIRQLIRGHVATAQYAECQRDRPDQPRIGQGVGSDVLVKLELLPVTNYLPDIARIRENAVDVRVAVGEYAVKKRTWLAQIACILAGELGGTLETFPGHHGAYTDSPEAWAAALREILYRASQAGRHSVYNEYP